MIEGPCVFVLKPNDRLYRSFYHIAISASALAIAIAVHNGKETPQEGHAGLGCLAKPHLMVKVPASMLVFRHAYSNKSPGLIHCEIAEGDELLAPFQWREF